MMTLNEEENVYGVINLGDGDGCLEEEKIIYLGDFDDDSLPDDPFGMGFNTLPRDPFGMDLNKEALVEDLGLKENGYEDNSNSNDDNRLKAGEDNNSVFVLWTGYMDYNYKQEEFDADSMVYTENKSYIVEDSWCFGCEKYENEDVNNDKGYAFEIANMSSFAELNVVWTEYKQEDSESDADSIIYTQNYSYIVEDSWCFGCEKYEIEHVNKDVNNAAAAAADIIIFVLGHLTFGVKDLLTVEMVCKSLRDAVRNDPYLWTKIHIDPPLNQKMCNDDLLRLTDRAQGKLSTLGLLKCLMITDDGLHQVLQRNLQLTKLSVAGSMKLSVEGVLNNLKVFNSVAKPGIKQLRIADINHIRNGEPIGITNEHLREFKLVLGADEVAKPKSRFFCAEDIYLSLDDERAIDIETCPRCQILRQVYDCPTENCGAEACKACIYCISRCIQCGCCLDNKAYDELFCFECRCFDCLRKLLESVKLPLYRVQLSNNLGSFYAAGPMHDEAIEEDESDNSKGLEA